MSIHVTIGYRDGIGDQGKPFVKIIDKKFEFAQQAGGWWEETGFNDGDGSVLSVLQAAEKGYVGTEHEIMTSDSKTGGSGNQDGGYTKLWCCIEGQQGKDTFDDRLKDLTVDEIVFMGDGHWQLNGRTLDDKKVWQSIYLMSNVRIKVSETINFPE